MEGEEVVVVGGEGEEGGEEEGEVFVKDEKEAGGGEGGGEGRNPFCSSPFPSPSLPSPFSFILALISYNFALDDPLFEPPLSFLSLLTLFSPSPSSIPTSLSFTVLDLRGEGPLFFLSLFGEAEPLFFLSSFSSFLSFLFPITGDIELRGRERGRIGERRGEGEVGEEGEGEEGEGERGGEEGGAGEEGRRGDEQRGEVERGERTTGGEGEEE